jgi:nicotinamidase-related amidase
MAPQKRCLLLIDLQNEFLSQDGNFPINKESRGFLDKLPELSAAFRASKRPIFWIRSEYGTTHLSGEVKKSNDNMRTWNGTHSGNTPCCEKGSIGAEFLDEVASLIAESESDLATDNVVVTKTWYSAFKDTSLFTELRDREITDLYIGGLLTNACVSATVLDARDLGFEVTLVEDCLGWRNRLSHDRALEQMLKHGAQIVSSNNLDTKRGSVIRFPQLFYVNGSVPSWRVMMALYEKVCFNVVVPMHY